MPEPIAAESVASARRARAAVTSGYYMAFISLGMLSASLGPTLPQLAAHTHSRLAEISFLFSGRAFGYLVGSLVGGRLYDRVPGHKIMMMVLCALAVLMAVVPLVPLLWLLTAIMLALGTAEGMLDLGGNTLLVWLHRADSGPFMNGLHFFFGVGALLSPVIIAQAVSVSGDIDLAYWLLGLLMLPALLWLARLPSPALLRSPEQDLPLDRSATVLVGGIALFFLLYVGAEASLGGWIYTYASEMGLARGQAAAYLTSGFWGALTIGRLWAIPVASRVRPQHILLADFSGCLAGLAAILLMPESPVALWAGTLLAGLSMASIFPTMISFAGRRVAITGSVSSWFFIGTGSGAMTVPWVIGQVFDPLGPRAAMVILAADLALALGVLGLLLLLGKHSRAAAGN